MLGNQRANVDGFFGAVVDLDPDRRPVDVGYFHAAPGGEKNDAVGRLDQPRVLDPRRYQHHLPTRRGADIAFGAHIAGARRFAKTQPAGQEVLVAELEGRHHQARHVHLRALAKHNAVGVDQEDAPVGQQGTQDARRVAARDPVQHRAGRVLLHKTCQLPAVDAKTLPVDDGAGCVGDGQRRAALLERGLSTYHLGRLRIGNGAGRRHRRQPYGGTLVYRVVLTHIQRTLVLVHSPLPIDRRLVPVHATPPPAFALAFPWPRHP